MGIKSYQDLEVWQKAMDLVVLCYKTAESFPQKEVYGLTSQLQRAAVSIPANIAEGRQRQYSKEFLQYLSVAYGSLAELETHSHIARRVGYIKDDQLNEILEKTSEIGRMLNGLRKSIEISGSRVQGSVVREQGSGLREQGSKIGDRGTGIRGQGPGRTK